MKTRTDRSHSFFSRELAAALALAFLLVFPGLVFAQEQLDVEISGLPAQLLENVKASLEIVQQGRNESLTPQMIQELHARAGRDIHRALEPFGYYRPQISAQLLQPGAGIGTWRATYKVDAGPPVPLSEIDVQFTGRGTADSGLLAQSETLSLRQEAFLDHRQYESAKKTLLQQVREQGYLDAIYTAHRVEVDLERYSASITLHIATGSQYVIGAIELDQQRFAPNYLARYMILKPGDPYSQKRIAQQRTMLSRSGYFQDVLIEPGEATGDAPPAIPLSIALISFKPNRYRGRIGWGTDTGFGVQTDWTRRYIGKQGHHFNLGLAAVEERQRFAGDLSYLIPLDPINGSHIELGVRHESKDLTFEDVDLEEGGESRIATNLASVFWHLPDSRFGDFELRSQAGLSLVGETYDVFEVLFGNLPGDVQDFLIERIGPEGYETLAPDFEAVVPGAGVTLRRSDNPLFIRRGDYFNLEVLGADESLGSNISFWQMRFNSWNIWSFGNSNRLLLRTAAGYTHADSRNVLGVNFNQMPEYYEFRAGGARSVRGYSFESLFPSDAITGGKHQLVASIEYEREIIPDWSLAVFLDGGNAFNDFDNIDEKLGAGLGIRWRSPFGLARIDLGIPLDDADESFQVYITVGPEF